VARPQGVECVGLAPMVSLKEERTFHMQFTFNAMFGLVDGKLRNEKKF